MGLHRCLLCYSLALGLSKFACIQYECLKGLRWNASVVNAKRIETFVIYLYDLKTQSFYHMIESFKNKPLSIN